VAKFKTRVVGSDVNAHVDLSVLLNLRLWRFVL
jgi:hypothetical protein